MKTGVLLIETFRTFVKPQIYGHLGRFLVAIFLLVRVINDLVFLLETHQRSIARVIVRKLCTVVCYGELSGCLFLNVREIQAFDKSELNRGHYVEP